MNKRRTANLAPAQIGLSLILVIFIVLCLVIFATLSLVTANQEEKHADKVAENVSQYYTADSLANDKLEEISDILNQVPTNTPIQDLSTQLLGIVDLSVDYPLLSYTVPISDGKELVVECEVEKDANDIFTYQIIRWEETVTDDFSGDDSLPLLNLGPTNE